YDGCGDVLEIPGCPGCQLPGISGTYRCTECFDHQMLCRNCCVQRHEFLPLHHINVSIDTWEEVIHLTWISFRYGMMGLIIHLGHTGCSMPKDGPASFTVIHTNGIHPSPFTRDTNSYVMDGIWLLIHQPQTCVTFVVLNHFHLQTLHSKVSATHFIAAIERETDNTGMLSMKMSREWRHLMMLKRAGRGHDDSGVKGTQQGTLAVLCPACLHPGINLPSNWESVPPSQQFLYHLHVAVDTNFRMKNHFKPGAPDPGLGTGWAYFVKNEEYKKFLLNYVSEKMYLISTCSGLAALDLANTRKSSGLHVTRVGMSVCACQGCIRALGLRDLQKGKRYSNMDYIIFSSLQSCGLRGILLSYDIFCQWSKKQQARHISLPRPLQLDPKINLTGVVPKFHLPAHKQPCQTKYLLYLHPGAGRTDGESIEHDWANLNPAASSMKEMGEGSHHNIIDDLLSDWNYRKVVGLGELLLLHSNMPLYKCYF
ncbi:hypothetical protein BS47DRAFT_1305009, partial [Hydnum rufescens UP504]